MEGSCSSTFLLLFPLFLHQTLKRPFSLEELPDFYRDPLTYNGRVPIFVKFFKSQFDYSDRVGNKGFVWPNKKAINEEVARLQANHHAIHRYVSNAPFKPVWEKYGYP